MAVFLLLVVLLMWLFYLADSHRLKTTRNQMFDKYKKDKLEPLCELLKSDDFDLYSVEKINWLLTCCDVKLASFDSPVSGASDFFSKYIFPFVTMFFGFAIKLVTITDGIAIVVAIAIVMVLAYFLKYVLAPIADMLFCPEKSMIQFLKSELEYIKVIL